MTFGKQMIEAGQKLERLGHSPVVSEDARDYASGRADIAESTKRKKQTDAIRVYFSYIENADAILVLNYDKSRVRGYIGPNCFLEIGYAYALRKNIYLLSPIPEMTYKDEIMVMNPTILNGDLSLIPSQ